MALANSDSARFHCKRKIYCDGRRRVITLQHESVDNRGRRWWKPVRGLYLPDHPIRAASRNCEEPPVIAAFTGSFQRDRILFSTLRCNVICFSI